MCVYIAAYCEDCNELADCEITQCAGSNVVVCELPNEGGSGKCTCATPEGLFVCLFVCLFVLCVIVYMMSRGYV